jgi:hypothetical protein
VQPAADRERIPQERFRSGEIVSHVEQLGEVFETLGGSIVLGAELATAELQRSPEQRISRREIASAELCDSQLIHRIGDGRVGASVERTTLAECYLQLVRRSIVQSEIRVHSPQRAPELGSNRGFSGQGCIDALHAAIEQIARGDVPRPAV